MTASGRWRATGVAGTAVTPGVLVFWNATAFLSILCLPSQLRLHQPFWATPAVNQLQAWVWGAAFLGFALFVGVMSQRDGGVRIRSALLASAACWGPAIAFLAVQRETGYSRGIAVLSVSMGISLAVLPFFLGARQRLWATALAVVTALLGWFGSRTVDPMVGSDGPVTTRILTATSAVTVSTFPNVVDSMETEGGAVEPLNDGFVLVTGEGEFYQLTWDRRTAVLRSRRLRITAPLDRATYLSDMRGPLGNRRLRVTDFVLDTGPTPAKVYVAHQHWDVQAHCFTLRVSVALLPDSVVVDATPPAWKTIYETAPCLPISESFDGTETGGRLAWYAGGTLLLTVGDHGLSGLQGEKMMAQDARSSYGKILRISLAGGHDVFTTGHRNPQGLEVDRDGRVWSTEHGPQGGDEVNVIERGNNYGWPLVSYGSQYGFESWPLGTGGRDHGRFVEPAHVFVPSIGISNLIQLGGAQFPTWDGDFLIGSLRGETLFRMRTRDHRVTYLEPIPIGRRIRDLAEARDGRVLLWTGERDVMLLSRAELTDGERAYGSCAECHGPTLAGTPRGPQLAGVFDRAIATQSGFVFSPALRGLRGSWNDDRLSAFLTDPQAYAPLTSMNFAGIADERSRRALIGYLHAHGAGGRGPIVYVHGR